MRIEPRWVPRVRKRAGVRPWVAGYRFAAVAVWLLVDKGERGMLCIDPNSDAKEEGW